MKQLVWILVLVFAVAPVFGQDPEETLTAGAQFAFGNLAVRDLTLAHDPVQELKAFFATVKLPLTSEQQRKLPPIVEAYETELEVVVNGVHTDGESVDIMRKLNQAYLKRVNDVLTPEQQGTWRHYRIDQIRLRGGYPALKSILEQVGVPLGPEQGRSIQQIFENFAARRARLTQTNPNAGMGDMDRLVLSEFNRIVALLTSDQRKALQASRRIPSAIAARR